MDMSLFYLEWIRRREEVRSWLLDDERQCRQCRQRTVRLVVKQALKLASQRPGSKWLEVRCEREAVECHREGQRPSKARFHTFHLSSKGCVHSQSVEITLNV